VGKPGFSCQREKRYEWMERWRRADTSVWKGRRTELGKSLENGPELINIPKFRKILNFACRIQLALLIPTVASFARPIRSFQNRNRLHRGNQRVHHMGAAYTVSCLLRRKTTPQAGRIGRASISRWSDLMAHRGPKRAKKPSID